MMFKEFASRYKAWRASGKLLSEEDLRLTPEDQVLGQGYTKVVVHDPELNNVPGAPDASSAGGDERVEVLSKSGIGMRMEPGGTEVSPGKFLRIRVPFTKFELFGLFGGGRVCPHPLGASIPPSAYMPYTPWLEVPPIPAMIEILKLTELLK